MNFRHKRPKTTLSKSFSQNNNRKTGICYQLNCLQLFMTYIYMASSLIFYVGNLILNPSRFVSNDLTPNFKVSKNNFIFQWRYLEQW